ncbi:MAG: ComEC family competence protein [Proteobacteria bacterium]|nr:ComEC family competence protein [Pseudomonadota bacterium]
MRLAIKAVLDQWHPPRDRVLWAPVLFGAGVALYFCLPFEPAYWASAACLLLATGLFITLILRAPSAFYAGAALFLVALGFLMAQGRSMTVHAPMLDRDTGITRVEGRVLDVSVTDDDVDGGKRRVLLGDLKIEKLKAERTPRTVRLSSRHISADVKPGDRIAVLAKLMPPSGPVVIDGFDYRRQAYFEGIGAVGFTLGQFQRIEKRDASAAGVWFSSLRQSISKRITTHMKHPESAVATALLAGERAAIPDDVNQSLLDSGLYHLLSISGLHVAIVCGVTFFVFRFFMALWPWFALHYPIKKYAALIALAVGIFYMLLAGAPVPTQRAMMTTGLVLLAVMLDRAALSMRTLAVAALALLALRPEALIGPSFQLSFAAVLSMIAFHEGIGRRWMAEHREMGVFAKTGAYLGGIFITTILVSFATFPVVLHHFGRVQLYGVLANAAAIPLTSFVVMPAGMAAMVLMPFGLDAPFLKVVEWGLTATLYVSEWVAGLPKAALAFPSLPLAPFLVSVSGFLLLMLWRGWFRWLGIGVMVAALIWGAFVPRALVLIDREGKLAAVKGDDGQVVFLFKKPTDYVRSNWMGYLGGEAAKKPLKQGRAELGRVTVSCDDWACRITEGDMGLSIVRDANALSEECFWAQAVLLATRAAPEGACPVTKADSKQLYMGGGGAVFRVPEGFAFVPTISAKYHRLWSPAHE